MLNIFRQRQALVKVVFGVILFLVVVSMAITLIPGITGDSSDYSANPVVAEVAGAKITESEVRQSVQQVITRNRVPPEMMPFYTNQILNEMILEKASLREASRLGLKVNESELLAQLRQNPELFPNGNFVGQEQYEDMISARFAMSVAQYEERYRQALLLDKLRQLVTDSITVTPAEIHEAFITANEKMVLDYVLLAPADFQKDISASDSVLEGYYKSNKDRYQVPEKRSAKMLLVVREKIRPTITVSEAEIKKYYQDHLEEYRIPERVMASHILLKADSKNPAQLEQARKKAEDLLKKLKGGADFAALAKQNSDDKASAANGGMLGFVTRKQTVPEFEKAAFGLQPGTISDPVQTIYGIHIIKVVSHDQAHLQPLEAVKEAIRILIRDQKVNSALEDEADRAAAALDRSPADIAAVAEKYHGEVLEPLPFMQNDTVPRLGNPELLQKVFGMEKGHAGSAVAVPEGYAIPVLLDVFPAHPGEWQEVKDQVKKDYIAEQSKAKALSKAQDLAKILQQQDKKDLKKAARSLGLTVKSSEPVTRDGAIPSLGSLKDLGPKTFSMPVGEVAGPASMGNGQVVYQVESREPPKEEDFAGKKAQIEQQLLGQKRQLAFDVFQDSLKSKLVASGSLKIHPDALARITSPGGSQP